mmetsp:Transcript_47454/g.136438  ORF Transcript_47454/g.136438 Transcript_47454/m.136438 type:complete len:267 (-) Transcript_47454:1142-1942(-)
MTRLPNVWEKHLVLFLPGAGLGLPRVAAVGARRPRRAADGGFSGWRALGVHGRRLLTLGRLLLLLSKQHFAVPARPLCRPHAACLSTPGARGFGEALLLLLSFIGQRIVHRHVGVAVTSALCVVGRQRWRGDRRQGLPWRRLASDPIVDQGHHRRQLLSAGPRLVEVREEVASLRPELRQFGLDSATRLCRGLHGVARRRQRRLLGLRALERRAERHLGREVVGVGGGFGASHERLDLPDLPVDELLQAAHHHPVEGASALWTSGE